MDAQLDERFLSDRQLAKRWSCSRATVWRRVKKGDIPAPTNLGQRMCRWRLSEIIDFENSRQSA